MIVASCGTNLLLVWYVFECEYIEGFEYVDEVCGVLVCVGAGASVGVGVDVLIIMNEAH